MNSCNFVGRLCADPELRRTGDGTAVCSYSLAVKRPMVKDTTDFPEIVSWRQSAEYLSQYGHKGDLVAVSGPLQSRKWKDKNDNNRISWEIQADSVELLSSKKNENTQQGGNSNSYARPQYTQQNFQQIDDPDCKLPF